MATPRDRDPRSPRPRAAAPPRARDGRRPATTGGAPKPSAKPAERRADDATDERVAQLEGPLAKVLRRLPEIERRVLRLRMGLEDGHPADLADTARAVGISSAEAKEIEARAFARIREIVPLEQLSKLLQG